MKENFEYVFSSNYGFIFLQDLFWEHFHEEHNIGILHKY